MKYAILTLALASTFATARTAESYIVKICGIEAERSELVVRLAKGGTPWAELESIFLRADPNDDMVFPRTAYYEYMGLDAQSIKTLTFMNCKIKYQKQR